MNSESKALSGAIPGPDQEVAGQRQPMQSDKAIPSQLTFFVREILVPLDFSEHSSLALKLAIRLAEELGARITLLHAIDIRFVPPTSAGLYLGSDLMEQVTWDAQQIVNRICTEEKLRMPLQGQTIVRTGVPSEIIMAAAEDQKFDLIILATHGRTRLARAFLGGTVESVIRQTPCPVLLVGSRQF